MHVYPYILVCNDSAWLYCDCRQFEDRVILMQFSFEVSKVKSSLKFPDFVHGLPLAWIWRAKASTFGSWTATGAGVMRGGAPRSMVLTGSATSILEQTHGDSKMCKQYVQFY